MWILRSCSDLDPCNRVKILEKLLYKIFTNICYTTGRIWFVYHVLLFFKSSWWPVLIVWPENLFNRTSLSSAIFVLRKLQLFSRNTLVRWCSRSSSSRVSNFVTAVKQYEKIVMKRFSWKVVDLGFPWNGLQVQSAEV